MEKMMINQLKYDIDRFSYDLGEFLIALSFPFYLILLSLIYAPLPKEKKFEFHNADGSLDEWYAACEEYI